MINATETNADLRQADGCPEWCTVSNWDESYRCPGDHIGEMHALVGTATYDRAGTAELHVIAERADNESGEPEVYVSVNEYSGASVDDQGRHEDPEQWMALRLSRAQAADLRKLLERFEADFERDAQSAGCDAGSVAAA
jgi:hypothetical protein